MGLSSYINNKTLNSYFSDILKRYDTDENGFTKKEFSNAIKGMTTIFAKSIIKFTQYDKKIFKELDIDRNDIVSYEELAKYVSKEYKLDFYSFKSMKVEDICNAIDNSDANNDN